MGGIIPFLEMNETDMQRDEEICRRMHRVTVLLMSRTMFEPKLMPFPTCFVALLEKDRDQEPENLGLNHRYFIY